MDKKQITRRKFIKTIGSFILGISVIPFIKFVNSDNNKDSKPDTKEARFYTSSDHLAG